MFKMEELMNRPTDNQQDSMEEPTMTKAETRELQQREEIIKEMTNPAPHMATIFQDVARAFAARETFEEQVTLEIYTATAQHLRGKDYNR